MIAVMVEIDDANAVLALLREAEQYNVGIAFVPDNDGWEVMHVGTDWPAHCDFEVGGGRLAYAYDLQTAAAAALRPLGELGQAFQKYLAERRD